MNAVADSSPLVILSKLDCLHHLHRVFPLVFIATEVHFEVVVAGAGLPGASEVEDAEWIRVRPLQNSARVGIAQRQFALGPGEMSTILLAKEIGDAPVLLDDFKARALARAEGLEVLGSVGLLEIFHLRGYLSDLRSAFQQLLIHNVYIDRRLLDSRLQHLGLPSL